MSLVCYREIIPNCLSLIVVCQPQTIEVVNFPVAHGLTLVRSLASRQPTLTTGHSGPTAKRLRTYEIAKAIGGFYSSLPVACRRSAGDVEVGIGADVRGTGSLAVPFRDRTDLFSQPLNQIEWVESTVNLRSVSLVISKSTRSGNCAADSISCRAPCQQKVIRYLLFYATDCLLICKCTLQNRER